MTTDRLNGILRRLLRNVRPLEEQDTDARLLDLYLRRRDEAAFESLMLRHGPLVLAVCRRVLVNEQDAEDAFQATFLVLIRKGASVKKQAALGAWLYRVAYRTAQEARRALARRRARETRIVPRQEAAPQDELREVLDRELAALPERYRAVIILCDLQGKERKEAALELSCPEGTVASRLARGRLLLAKRLARHGLTMAALAAASQQATASVPTTLASMVRAALSPGAGAAGAVSANVSFLVERVVRSMLMVKLRTLTAVALLGGLVASGAGWLYFHRQATAQPNIPRDVPAPARPGDRPEPAPDQGRKADQENGLPPLLQARPIKVDKQDDELHKLLKDRYNEALQELSLRFQLFQLGRQTLSGLHEAGMRLVKAGLELNEKPKDQVAFFRGYVEVMKEVEKTIDKRFTDGRIGLADVCQAHYYRMDAEIELLRLERKVK